MASLALLISDWDKLLPKRVGSKEAASEAKTGKNPPVFLLPDNMMLISSGGKLHGYVSPSVRFQFKTPTPVRLQVETSTTPLY